MKERPASFFKAALLSLLLALCLSTAGFANPLRPEQVPGPLKPWIDWALHGRQEAACPALWNTADERRCRWPGLLRLDVDGSGGRFEQAWELFVEEWVPLPAHQGSWPVDVQANGRPAVVIARDGVPSVRLGAGQHRLTGRFDWPQLPEFLDIPGHTGLLSVVVKGKPAPFRLDRDGRLWLKETAQQDTDTEERLSLQVFRKLGDGIPVTLTTRLVLDVSGPSRELVFDRILPGDFVPVTLQSELPTRSTGEGGLRIQVRPGRWELDLVARHRGPLDRLSFETPGELWVAEEIWSFEANPAIRLVTPQGLTGVDPRQSGVPAAWAGLPAFLARPGETLSLRETRRGDPEPAPDQLTLHRDLWLDFDGRGFTLRDHIGGIMTQGWRLEMLPPFVLGRVAVDGEERLITRNQDQPGIGVEVRRGQLSLVADSRLEKRSAQLPATGWNRPFSRVETTLNLPPGWRLLYATGADSIPGVGPARWSLLDLFIVLLTVLAVGKLWGWRWGLVALLALGLSYHEPGAPRWIWLQLLAGVSLVRVLPAGKLRLLAGCYRNALLLILLLVLLPFAAHQVHSGLYPQLESRRSATVSMDRAADSVAREQALVSRAKSTSAAGGRLAPAPTPTPRRLSSHDPDALVQTGPGLPGWQWRSVPIAWSGPVRADQTLGLYLISPRINLLLAFARVLLLGILAWLMLDSAPSKGGGRCFRPGSGWLPLLAVALLAAQPAQGAIPDQETLQQLQQRLLTPASCFPHCADLHSLELNYTPTSLSLDLTLHADAPVAVPLPGERSQWSPSRVRLNGQPVAIYLDEEGRCWVPLTAGRHRLTMQGPLPNRPSVVLSLPLSPRRLAAAGQGWQLEGGSLRRPPAQLQLSRLAASGQTAEDDAEPLTLPSYFQVERTLKFDLQWTVHTRVVRRFKGGSAGLVRIPLLDGEAVTSDNIPVREGHITLQIPADVDEIRWQSLLPITPELTLRAASSEQWSETWRLDASPVWHVEATGLAVIHHQDRAGHWLPEWRPWPQEDVLLHISRPQGVPGRTLTIDNSALQLKPGRRTTENRLQIQLRSSMGGQHSLRLPEGAELQQVRLNGAAQPLRPAGRILTLPVMPGETQAEIFWLSPTTGGALSRTPEIDLGAPSVNANLRLEIPRDRWVLFAKGPQLGPAVLFWSLLLVLLPLAFGLGRTGLTPLRFHHWLLLGIGLTQLRPLNAVLVVGWLLALGWRHNHPLDGRDRTFNLVQILLVGLTVLALLSLFVSVQQGLLGDPHMQIAGNGSSAYQLNWFQDRTEAILPRAWTLSVPMTAYRLLMLSWALWLALALLRWLKWGWQAYSKGGLWRPMRRKAPKVQQPSVSPPQNKR